MGIPSLRYDMAAGDDFANMVLYVCIYVCICK